LNVKKNIIFSHILHCCRQHLSPQSVSNTLFSSCLYEAPKLGWIYLFFELNLLSVVSRSCNCWIWARPGRKTRTAPSTSRNWGDLS